MAKFLDPDHPMFRPLWVRLLIVAVTAGWATVEFVTGSATWGTIALALAAYEVWVLLITFDPDKDKTR